MKLGGWLTDPVSIANKIRYLYKDKTLLEKASKNAARIKDDFVWEKTVQALVDHYERTEPSK